MKRRSILKSIVAGPAAAQSLALAQAPRDVPVRGADDRASGEGELRFTSPEASGAPAPGFFTPRQLAALKDLCGRILPPAGEMPGAIEAGVAEFIDFLIRKSPNDRQQLYKDGLDRLAAEPKALDAAIGAKWGFYGPDDPFARFIHDAKLVIFQATMNSREWAAAGHGRRAGGANYYWRAIE
jgi:hypothetical protein